METKLNWENDTDGGTQAIVPSDTSHFELATLQGGVGHHWRVWWVKDEQARSVVESLTCAPDEATAQAAAETALRAFLASALKALGVDVEAMQAEGRRLFDENASLLRGWVRMEAALLQHRSKCPVAAWSDSDLSEALAGSTSALDAIKQQVRSEERARIVARIRKMHEQEYAGRAKADREKDDRGADLHGYALTCLDELLSDLPVATVSP